MSSFSTDTRSMSSSPLFKSLVKNRLFETASDIDEPPFQFIHTMDLSAVEAMLHDRQPRSRNPQDWNMGCLEATAWTQESLAFLAQQFNCCTCAARRASALSCWNKVVTRHSAYRWQQYDVIMTSWSSIEEFSKSITRNCCSVTTMKLPHALNSFCEAVYAVAFSRQCSNKL